MDLPGAQQYVVDQPGAIADEVFYRLFAVETL
jgi:hypothetical protein